MPEIGDVAIEVHHITFIEILECLSISKFPQGVAGNPVDFGELSVEVKRLPRFRIFQDPLCDEVVNYIFFGINRTCFCHKQLLSECFSLSLIMTSSPENIKRKWGILEAFFR